MYRTSPVIINYQAPSEQSKTPVRPVWAYLPDNDLVLMVLMVLKVVVLMDVPLVPGRPANPGGPCAPFRPMAPLAPVRLHGK